MIGIGTYQLESSIISDNFGGTLNPFTGDFTVTISDINGLFIIFLHKIYSKTGI